MHNGFENDKRWDGKAARANRFDNRHPFTVAWLRNSGPTSSIASSNDFCGRNHAQLEASFVKIVDIIFQNPVFSDGGLYSLEPRLNKLRIFAFCSLIIVFTIIF